MPLLLAIESIGADTSVSLGLIVAVSGLLFGAITASIASRITHGIAIKQQRVDLEKLEAARRSDAVEADARANAADTRLRALEEWRIRREALDDAAVQASSSTTRGTRPYTRG